MPHVFRFQTDEQKGPGCGYRVVNHYIVEESREAAEATFDERDAGLCGDCLLDIMAEEQTTVEAV